MASIPRLQEGDLEREHVAVPHSLKSIFAPFKQDLAEFDLAFRNIMRSDVWVVDQMAQYLVKHKGKQFRPALVLVAARAAGEVTPKTYSTAAVAELLHTATLIHDDVLDDSEMRRGIATLHKVWKNKLAILMGDYLLSKSLIAATETGSLEIMNTVATVAKRLIKGAMLEVQKSHKPDLDEADYFRIVADKTASLMSACTELGALTVNASPERREAMRDFGENLGIAFQIKDDLLDYEGSSGILGKPAMADIQDKKVTLPLLYALQDSDEKERKHILKIIRKGASRKEVAEILDFVKRRNGIEKAREKAREIKNKAIMALSVLPDSDARDSLIQLAEFVVNRNK